MKTLVLMVVLMFVGGSAAEAQTPRQIHLSGAQAGRLISLLATGNDAIAKMLKEEHRKEFVVRGLTAVKFSTNKYDESEPYFGLGIYQAWVKLGANDRTPVGEATAVLPGEETVTVAVKVTAWPNTEGAGEAVTAAVVSALLTASVTGLPRRFSICARSRSAPVISARPSTRKMMWDALSSATSACRRICAGMYS